jgi:hypothetical protein
MSPSKLRTVTTRLARSLSSRIATGPDLLVGVVVLTVILSGFAAGVGGATAAQPKPPHTFFGEVPTSLSKQCMTGKSLRPLLPQRTVNTELK